MPTKLDEYLASIIQTANSIRNALTPKVLAQIGPDALGAMLAEAKEADKHLGEVDSIIQG